MPATEPQLLRLRRDWGDVDKKVFKTDDELQDIWERVAGASSEAQQHRAALGLMFEQVLNSSVKLHDYTAGETSEKLSQVVAQLERRAANYAPDVAAATSTRTPIAKAALRPKPRQGREWPNA